MIKPADAMGLAIAEARKGLGCVAPNPPVGCVILDAQNNMIAKGHHRAFGEDHAEVNAVKNLASPVLLKGATVYVTLEPCAHQGKTPPCADFLAKLPIKKVVYGLRDPNPLVAGQGEEKLRQAGIAVELCSDLQPELEELAEVFLWHHRQKKTFVALKVATSLDGQLAHASGESKWLTGEGSRQHAHYLRAMYDAVLVGKNTLLMDNPSLNIRHPEFSNKKNKVVVLDARGETLNSLHQLNVRKVHNPEDIFVFVGSSVVAPSDFCARVVQVPLQSNGNLCLTSTLEKLFELGVGSVLVEGGAAVASSFLQQKLVQRYYQFIAPILIGAQSGVSFTKNMTVSSLAERAVMGRPRHEVFGTDIMITGRL